MGQAPPYDCSENKSPNSSGKTPSPAGRSPQRGRVGEGVALWSASPLFVQSPVYIHLSALGVCKHGLARTPCVPPVTPPPPSPTGGGGLSGGYPGGGWQMVCRFGFRFTYTLSAQVYVSGDRQWDKLRLAMFGRRRCLDVKSLTLPPPQPFLALRASCSSPAAGFALQGRGQSGGHSGSGGRVLVSGLHTH